MNRFSIARGMISIEAQIKDLDRQKEEAVMGQDFEKAVRIKDEKEKLQKSLDEIKNPPISEGTWAVSPEEVYLKFQNGHPHISGIDIS